MGDAYVFPGFLKPVLTQLFFPKPLTTFFTCFCRGERQQNAGKKKCLNLGSNSQPPGHESDMLTTEPPCWGYFDFKYLKYCEDLALESFLKRQILDSSKLKDFAANNFKFDENGKKFSKLVEYTVGEGEIAHYEQFLLFRKCFQKNYTADT